MNPAPPYFPDHLTYPFLASQHFSPPPLTPCQRLLHAILREACQQLVDGRKAIATIHGQRAVEEVTAWITSSEAAWPCSFIRICEELGLDVEATRCQILTDAVPSVRRDPFGNVLPFGIHMNMVHHSKRPYRVTTYPAPGKVKHFCFATLSEASAFRTRIAA